MFRVIKDVLNNRFNFWREDNVDIPEICQEENKNGRRYRNIPLYTKEEMENAIIDDSEENIINYLHDMQETCENEVVRSYKKWQENIKETEEKNLWMKQFLDSLETITDETRV